MAKTKERSEAEYLRAENRALRKQTTVLKKEVSSLRKRLTKYEGYVDSFTYEKDAEPAFVEIYDDKQCAQCSKGRLHTVDLGIRKIVTCNQCGFREVVKYESWRFS